MVSIKPAIKSASTECLLIIFEKCDRTELFNSINVGMESKNPKQASQCIVCVIELLKNFGPKKLDLCKPF